MGPDNEDEAEGSPGLPADPTDVSEVGLLEDVDSYLDADPEAFDAMDVEPQIEAVDHIDPTKPGSSGDQQARLDAQSQRHLRGLLESLLFVAERPMKAADLAEIARAELVIVRQILQEMANSCRQEQRGFLLEELAGGFQFRTNATFAPFVRELTGQKPVRLTRPQVETLAIIAYRQPITRPEIEDIRGVDAGPVVKVLFDRDLVRVLGRKEEPGRPVLYGTSAFFLQFFGLKSLRDLPTLREFTELTDESKDVVERELGEVLPEGPREPPPAVPSTEDISPETSSSELRATGAIHGAMEANDGDPDEPQNTQQTIEAESDESDRVAKSGETGGAEEEDGGAADQTTSFNSEEDQPETDEEDEGFD